jgi:signal transduction histidine kinase/DNA-binding response OmpR family regulator
MLLGADGDLWMLDRSAGGILLDFDPTLAEVLRSGITLDLSLLPAFDPPGCAEESRKSGWPTPHEHRMVSAGNRRIGTMVHFSPWISWAMNERSPPVFAVPEELRPLPSTQILYQHLYADPFEQDLLWSATRVGVVQISRSARRIRWLSRDPRSAGALKTNEIYQVHRAQSGSIWVATDLGLQRYRQDNSSFAPVISKSGGPRSPTAASVYCLLEDSRRPSMLWMGTDMGLASLDTESYEAKWYSGKGRPLPSHPVHEIISDAEGALWLGVRFRVDRTGLDLTRFDPELETVAAYRVAGGVDPIFFDSRTKHILIGGLDGYYDLDPSMLILDSSPPSLLAYEPMIDGEIADEAVGRAGGRPLWSGSDVRLQPGSRDLRIEYVALHYEDAALNRYATMLEGYDDGWRMKGRDRVAQYSNLSPGTYTFRLRAAGATGVWTDPGLAIPIVVMAPWWRTTAAFATYAIMMAFALLAGGLLWKSRVLRRERGRAALRESKIRSEVAELKATQAAEHARRLEELDAAKSRFFANVSHEFRTPLTLVLGPVEDAIRGEFGAVSAELRRQHVGIRRNAEKLLRLVNQLLDLTRLDAGALHLHPREGDLVQFLRDLTASFGPLAERRDVTVSFTTRMDRLRVAFDRDALEKVFGNLLSNALKFTPGGGNVTVNLDRVVRNGEPSVAVSVSDTGPGIEESDLDIIFDRYGQSRRHGDWRHDGSGIGLALAKELVSLHGGQIDVQSVPLKGSTFIVSLPDDLVATDHRGKPQADSDRRIDPERDGDEQMQVLPMHGMRSAGSGGGEPRPTVLVVDDNGDVREWLRTRLVEDFEVLEARDGEEGLEVVRANHPDLVLLDVMMPRVDGFGMCRMIKEDDALQHIPVVMLTARAGEEATVEGLRCGADDYIAKPFSINELRVRITNLISSRSQLRARFRREIVVRPADIEITREDEAFLKRVLAAANEHLEDSNYSVDWLADEVGMSRRQVDRRITASTGQTAAQLIRYLRLTRASQLLRSRGGSVTEIAYAVGFRSPAHFAKAFRDRFGVSPSDHAAQNAEPLDVLK